MANRTAERLLGAAEQERLASGHYAGAVALSKEVELPQETGEGGSAQQQKPVEMRFYEQTEEVIA